MQFKLVDIYNTRYFYLPFNRDLVYLFDTFLKLQQDKNYPHNDANELLAKVYSAAIAGTDVEFDLADAKLTPDTSKTIQAFTWKGINFVDTKDSNRNAILLENRKRRSIDVSDCTVLPEFDINQKIKDYISALDPNVQYSMMPGKSFIYVPLCIMIQIARPSINIVFNYHCSDIMNFVGTNLTTEDLKQYNEFYFTTPEGTQVIKLDSDGKFETSRAGRVDLETALSLGSLVPTVFGKDKLIDEECWRVLFTLCLKKLNHYKSTRTRTLDEVL